MEWSELVICIPKQMKERLQKEADIRGVPLQTLVMVALDDFLQNEDRH